MHVHHKTTSNTVFILLQMYQVLKHIDIWISFNINLFRYTNCKITACLIVVKLRPVGKRVLFFSCALILFQACRENISMCLLPSYKRGFSFFLPLVKSSF